MIKNYNAICFSARCVH